MQDKCPLKKPPFTVSPHADLLSKAELFKVYLSVDREVIKESNAAGASLKGLGTVKLDDLINDVMQADISDQEIDAFSVSSLMGMGFLRELVKGIDKTAPGPVSKATAKIMGNAADAVNAAGMTPTRNSIAALKSITGPLAKSFVYAFIPADAKALFENPEVERKSNEQKKSLDKLATKMNFQPDYLMKHLRNLITRHYRKNPEQIIHDLANSTETEFNFSTGVNGLGAFDLQNLIDLGTEIGNAVGEVQSVISKTSVPTTQDWNLPLKDSDNITDDPAYGESFWSSAAGIATIVGGVVVVGGGTYYLATS